MNIIKEIKNYYKYFFNSVINLVFIRFAVSGRFKKREALPKMMSLDTLIRLLTEKDTGMVPAEITVFSSEAVRGEPAAFLWGIMYQKITAVADPRLGNMLVPKTFVELVYESRSGEIYVVKPKSTEDMQQTMEVTGIVDRRYKVFGSTDLYKAFFGMLNSDRIEGKIDERDYMQIFTAINRAEVDIFAKSLNKFMVKKLFGLDMLSYFQKDAEIIRMIDYYIRRAKLHLEEKSMQPL